MINIEEYKDQIIKEIENIHVPDNIDILHEDIVDAYKKGRAIENILLPLYNEIEGDELVLSDSAFNPGLKAILDFFEARVYELLENEKLDFEQRRINNRVSNKNLFEVANTINLYLSNKYTRVISENLGHRLEDIATLSPKVINPEVHFGFKMKGIDVVIYNNNNFYFCQLKTKKDTLTGSQKGRSEIELAIHPRSLFVACLSLGKSFTFNTDKPNIERIHGEDFWDILDIDYDALIEGLSQSLQEIERKLFNED